MYDQTLENMEATHRALASRVPPPKQQQFGHGVVFRYQEKNIHQAIIQKLARVVSGLRASRLLLENGLFQELAAIQRLLDEFREDVIFLAYALTNGPVTELHTQYLDAFYEEEFDDPTSAFNSTQKRPMIPRRKIRAYLAQIKKPGSNPSDEIENMRTVEKVYSGFVHGASPQIMEMYDGDPPSFQLRGMLGTRLEMTHRVDLWNYFYRGINIFIVAAKAFGDGPLAENIARYAKNFAASRGYDFTKPPTKMTLK